MRKLFPSHLILISLIQVIFSFSSVAHTVQFYSDSSKVSSDLLLVDDQIFYSPVCASNGRTYLNTEAAHADGVTHLEPGRCSSYETVQCLEPGRLWITEVDLNGMSEKSGPEGYRKATNVIFDVFKHNNNVISLHGHHSSKVESLQWKVWIDFDGDTLFEEEEVVVNLVTTDSTVPIFIPQEVEIGKLTRMRVFMGERGDDLRSNTIQWGEVEDYTVQVLR